MAWLSRSLCNMFTKKYELMDAEVTQLQHTLDAYEKYCDQLSLTPATRLYILTYMKKQLKLASTMPSPNAIKDMFLGSAIIAAKMTIDYPTTWLYDFRIPGTIFQSSDLTTKNLERIEKDCLTKLKYILHIKDIATLHLLKKYFDKTSLSELQIDLIKERTLTDFRFKFLIQFDGLLKKHNLPSILNKDRILLVAEHINQFPLADWKRHLNELNFDSYQRENDFEYYQILITLLSLQKPEERMQIAQQFRIPFEIEERHKNPRKNVLLKELFKHLPTQDQQQLLQKNSKYLQILSKDAFQWWLEQRSDDDIISYFQINQSMADELDTEKVKLILAKIDLDQNYISFIKIFSLPKAITTFKDICTILNKNIKPTFKANVLIRVSNNTNLLKNLRSTKLTTENCNEIFDIIETGHHLSKHLNLKDFVILSNALFINLDTTITILIHSNRPNRENLMNNYFQIDTLKKVFITESSTLLPSINKIEQQKELQAHPEIFLSLITGLINTYKSTLSPMHHTVFAHVTAIKMTHANQLLEAIKKRTKIDTSLTHLKDELGNIAKIYMAYFERQFMSNPVAVAKK